MPIIPEANIPYLYSQTTGVTENDDKDYKKYQQDHILNYKKNFGDHTSTVTGGFTTYYFGTFQRQVEQSGQTATGGAIPNDPRFWYINNGFQDPSTTSASSDQSEYQQYRIWQGIIQFPG